MNNYTLRPYRIVFKFKIKLASPLIIGNNESENSDNDVLKDKNGTPFIPATSFAGVLRHFINENYSEHFSVKRWFGSAEEDKGYASKIIFSDIIPEGDVKTGIRDGIKIDNTIGITVDKAKFDYEVIEPGTVFHSYIEIEGKEDEEDIIKRLIKTIERDLKEGRIKLGAKTNKGFGEIKLIQSSINFYNLRNKQDVILWLGRKENIKQINAEAFPYTNNNFLLDFYFFVKDSLIVKSYVFGQGEADSVHMKSGNLFIIPGTSIKGALRARAEKIVNTLGIKNGKRLLTYLFGDSLNDENKGSIPGRLQVNEVRIEQKVEPGIQKRIKIDRFTGGTIMGALFDSMPIFAVEEDRPNKMRIKIKNPADAEVGLILLLLKDLWTGDLAIGGEKNIGRGVVKGKSFNLYHKGFSIEDGDLLHLKDEEKTKCQHYVNEFINGDLSAFLDAL